MSGRKWTQEEKDALSLKMKARKAEKALAAQTLSEILPGPQVVEHAAPILLKKDWDNLPPPTAESPPRNLFTGTVKNLDVFGLPGTKPNEPVPGCELYWAEDRDGGKEIEQCLASGWRFVDRSEVALSGGKTSARNVDLGNHVTQWVSQSAMSEPVHVHLMKKPIWLCELHRTGPDSIEQQVHRRIEEQLRQGTYDVGRDEKRYAGVRGANISLGGFKSNHS